MKKYVFSLLSALILSALIVAGMGGYMKYHILKPMDLYQDRSVMELPFLMVTDDALVYMVRMYAQNPSEPTAPSQPSVTEPEAETSAPPETTLPPETEPPTVPPAEPEKVEESWFDDALFIGNSLGVGLRDYAPLGEADYFCRIGLNIFKIKDTWADVKGVGKRKLERLLDEQEYGKIFIHLGTNECGYPVDSVTSAFRETVELIREKQPDAAIVIHGTMTFGRAKKKDYRYMVPETITNLNASLKTLADPENNIHYIEFNPEVVDEEGYLPREFSSDGCHPTVDGYRKWAQWLWDTACYLDIPEPSAEASCPDEIVFHDLSNVPQTVTQPETE